MMIFSFLLVVSSGLMNALWNLFAKRSRNKNVFLGLIMIVPTAALLPHLIWELSGWSVPAKAYFWMACSLFIQIFYASLLSRAYLIGDLSALYPVMRGTGVVLVPLAGVFLLGERMTVWGWLGIVCIISGLLTAGLAAGPGFGSSRSPRFGNYRSLVWAFAVGLCIASYTLVDKVTLQYISPLSLLQVSSMGFMLAHVRDLLKRDRLREEWVHNRNAILLGSLLSPGSYLLFLLAIATAPVSHLAPVREIGTVFAALFGVLLLKEKQGRTRLVTSVVVTVGIIMLGFHG